MLFDASVLKNSRTMRLRFVLKPQPYVYVFWICPRYPAYLNDFFSKNCHYVLVIKRYIQLELYLPIDTQAAGGSSRWIYHSANRNENIRKALPIAFPICQCMCQYGLYQSKHHGQSGLVFRSRKISSHY